MWPEINHREAIKKAEYSQTLLFVDTHFKGDHHIIPLTPPEPDFLLELGGKRIGIEHTLLSYNDQDLGENRNQISSIVRDISLAAEQTSIGVLPEKGLSIFLSFEFTSLNKWLQEGNRLKKKDKLAIAQAIVDLLKDAVPAINQTSLIEKNYSQPNLCRIPFPIESIFIYHTHLNIDTHFGGSGGYTVLGLNPVLVSNAIARKETKIKNYKNAYDEKWLLMIVNKFSYESDIHLHDTEDLSKEIFLSEFEKAFVFESATKVIVEIRTSNDK